MPLLSRPGSSFKEQARILLVQEVLQIVVVASTSSSTTRTDSFPPRSSNIYHILCCHVDENRCLLTLFCTLSDPSIFLG